MIDTLSWCERCSVGGVEPMRSSTFLNRPKCVNANLPLAFHRVGANKSSTSTQLFIRRYRSTKVVKVSTMPFPSDEAMSMAVIHEETTGSGSLVRASTPLNLCSLLLSVIPLPNPGTLTNLLLVAPFRFPNHAPASPNLTTFAALQELPHLIPR